MRARRGQHSARPAWLTWRLDPGEPVETLRAPERLAEIVGHFDGLDPLGVLVAELG